MNQKIPLNKKEFVCCAITYKFYADKNYAIAEYEDRGSNFYSEQYMANEIRKHFDEFFIMLHIKGAMYFYPEKALDVANKLFNGCYVFADKEGNVFYDSWKYNNSQGIRYKKTPDCDQREFEKLIIEDGKYAPFYSG